MRRSLPTNAVRNIAALAILVALTAGCAQTKEWFNGIRPGGSSETTILGAPDAEQYLTEMHQLASGDPATQAEIYADAESAAKLTPGPSTKLRYALVLATPGHSENNPQAAQTAFRELLTQREMMTPAEVALASIHLDVVEQQIVFGAENRRLRSINSRAATTEEQAVAERIAKVESENRQLRRSLEEAEQKLDAITSIERSIREQANSEPQ
jgi:hypothetical protein